jgi:hypothetical protein
MNEVIDRETWQPLRIAPSGIDSLKGQHPELSIVDQYKKNLEELFLLRNPKYRFDKNYAAEFDSFCAGPVGKGLTVDTGEWFYFPWLNTLIHFLPEDLHYELRTGRNRNLIPKEEQDRFYGSTIAVLGMSVGSHVALMIAMTGGAKHLRLADPDAISGDNLNRIRSGYQNVGINKAIVVARQIAEMNPYADIKIYKEGLQEANMQEILDGATLVAEEMDSPFFKLKIREMARSRRIPVVMGTDNGDGVIVDIERFDLDGNYPILHGKVGSMTAEQFRHLSPKDLPRVAAKIAGADLAVPRMLLSVTEVGKTLYSWPQLGSAANLCGTVVSYLARRIVLKAPNIKSGRYQVSLDGTFESDYKRKWFSRKVGFIKFAKKMQKQ